MGRVSVRFDLLLFAVLVVVIVATVVVVLLKFVNWLAVLGMGAVVIVMAPVVDPKLLLHGQLCGGPGFGCGFS